MLYCLRKTEVVKLPFEAGIISFKNLNNGFLKFSKKDKAGRGAKKESKINSDLLQQFTNQLEMLLCEILNPEVDFIEKEIE